MTVIEAMQSRMRTWSEQESRQNIAGVKIRALSDYLVYRLIGGRKEDLNGTRNDRWKVTSHECEMLQCVDLAMHISVSGIDFTCYTYSLYSDNWLQL
jgi:hypothetical protein